MGDSLNYLRRGIRLNFLRSGNRSRALEIAIYSVIAFAAVSALRTYHFASGYGWFDPWVQIGYGQLFPDTSFDFHYYKESRIVSIAWTALILKFDAGFVNLFWQSLVTATSVMTYLTFRLADKNRIVSAIGGIFVALSFPLWGDYAGGGDYYNTLGNFIISVACYITFLVLGNLSNMKSELANSKLYFLLGIIFSVIALETPSGITILLPLQMLIVLRIWQFSKIQKKKVAEKLFRLLQFQILGFFALIFFEILILLALNQNPLRLLTGPYFLMQSITDSSTTSPWAKPLLLQDFFTQPNLLIFITLFIVEFLYLISILLNAKRQITLIYNFLSASVPFLFYVLLITLQLLERTIIFTTSYFLTPVILMGIILLSRIQISLNRYWLATSLFLASTFVFIFQIGWTLYLISAITVGIFGYLLTSRQYKKNFFQFSPTLMAFIILTFMMKSFSPIITNTRSDDFGICETTRIEMRAEVIKASTLLDQLGFRRGTLIMGADMDVIRNQIRSKCSDFDNKPLGGVLIAISQTGFPSAAVLGAVNAGLEYDVDDFVEQNLSHIEGRTNAPTSCYVNFRKSFDGSDLVLQISGSKLGVDLKCPQ
jgi:hypothetical protein